MDFGFETSMKANVKRLGVLVKIYECLFNKIMNSEVNKEKIEDFIKEFYHKTAEHVKKVVEKV